MPRHTRKLRIVVFQEGESVCAQWVDFDLSAQARTLPLLYRAMDRLIRGHLAIREKHGVPRFKDLLPAPEKFREMFDRSKIDLPPLSIELNWKIRPEVRFVAAA